MLAENLVMLRDAKGMTQEQVAEVIGISRQSYAKWEQGETVPDIDKCARLAAFYGVKIDEMCIRDSPYTKRQEMYTPLSPASAFALPDTRAQAPWDSLLCKAS